MPRAVKSGTSIGCSRDRHFYWQVLVLSIGALKQRGLALRITLSVVIFLLLCGEVETQVALGAAAATAGLADAEVFHSKEIDAGFACFTT